LAELTAGEHALGLQLHLPDPLARDVELVERIAQEAGVTEGEAQGCLGAFERVVTEALKGGEEVRITGFGTEAFRMVFFYDVGWVSLERMRW
jgi:DNA-binding protein